MEHLSYVHGAVETPLLGETLGASFDRTVAQWGDRPALVVRSQGIRWTYRELSDQAEAFAAGLLALGVQPGDRVGIWSLNCAEWLVTQIATAKAGIILVNINPAYRTTELHYALNKVGVRALITATAFKTSDYIGLLTTVLPETRRQPTRRLARRRRTVFAHRHPDRRHVPRHHPLRRGRRTRHPGRTRPPRRARRHVAIRRPDQHPVHLRHHRLAEGRRTHPPQHPQQRLLHRRGHEADRAGPPLHPGAAVPLLRHGAGQPSLHHPWRRHDLPRRGLRPARRAANRRRGTLHRPARRPHHVHRRDGTSPLRRIRPVHVTHRHHGRLPLPDRSHAPGWCSG